MSIKNLTKKQIAYLKDKGTITVKKTLSDRISIPSGESTRFKDAKGDLSFGMDICRDGVQEYLASEIFDNNLLKENDIAPDSIIRVWRPPTVVFNPEAVKSHNGLPMTRNHPDVWVDAGNRIMLEKGLARDCWYNKDKATVSGTGFVTDASMVSEIESGKFTDISDGYDSELDFEPGKVPEMLDQFPCTNSGEDYDMIMKSYKPNHIAIVPEGRAGNAKILDHGKGVAMNFIDKLTKKFVKDALSRMTDQEKAAMLAEEEEDPDKKEVLESIGKSDTDDKSGIEAEEKDATIVGGYNNIDVPEFNTDGAAVNEAAVRKAVLAPDGSINRVIHGIKDSKGNPVRVVRQFDAVIEMGNEDITGDKPADGGTQEVKDMQIDEATETALENIVNKLIEKRLGGEPDGDEGIPGSGIPAAHEEPDGDEPEYVGDKEAAEIGIAEEYPEAGEDAEPEKPGEPEKPVTADAEPAELTAEQLMKYATGATDPETKRMALALSEKIASEAKKTADADPETEKARLAAAAEGKPAPEGSPSNQVTDEEPDEEKDGYLVPKKLADSDGERAKILLDSVSTVKAYGLQGIDPEAHAKDGTIYNRIIDAAGLPKVTQKNRITREMIDTAINVIAANRPLVDGMASLTRHIHDTKQTSGGYNPGEEY